jgi:hypothetical protein
MDDHRKECPFCGKIIADGIPFCPYCGEKQPQALSEEEINKNPYKILEVSEDAEQEVIEAAYRSLARKYHPDSGVSSVSEGRMQEINWAHGIISNPEKLAEWKLKNRKKQAPKSSYKAQASPIKKTSPANEPKSPPTNNKTQTVSSNPSSISQTDNSRSQFRKNKNTSNFVPLVIVVSVILFAVGILFILVDTSSNNQYVPPTPTLKSEVILYPTALPTDTISNTPTSTLLNCILWSNLNNSDVNLSECVYGRVVKIYSTDQLAQIIRFSNEAGTFLIWSQYKYFPDVHINDCVAAVGYINQNVSEMYMDIENIDLYEYAGCQ